MSEDPVVECIITLARDPSQDGFYRAGEIHEVMFKRFAKSPSYEYVGCIETVHYTSRPGRFYHFRFMLRADTLAFLAEQLAKLAAEVS